MKLFIILQCVDNCGILLRYETLILLLMTATTDGTIHSYVFLGPLPILISQTFVKQYEQRISRFARIQELFIYLRKKEFFRVRMQLVFIKSTDRRKNKNSACQFENGICLYFKSYTKFLCLYIFSYMFRIHIRSNAYISFFKEVHQYILLRRKLEIYLS